MLELKNHPFKLGKTIHLTKKYHKIGSFFLLTTIPLDRALPMESSMLDPGRIDLASGSTGDAPPMQAHW